MLKIVPVEAPAPTIKILRETFRPTCQPRVYKSAGVSTEGVVTVEYADAVVEARAVLWDSGSLFVYGFVARYQTGKKIWRASISQLVAGEEPYISFGRMHRNGARRKNATVWYAPKLWPTAYS